MNLAFRQPGLKTAAIAVGAIALLLIVSQLSALVFLALIGAPVSGATPLTMIQYAAFFGGSREVTNALWIALGVGTALAASPALMLLAPDRARPLHGEADWANRREVRKAGLLENHGIIVGKIGNSFVHHNGSGRVSPQTFLAAPTGSGKTQGVMFPNALSWPGSLVVTDIKGELYTHSARFRAEAGQAIYVLDFCPHSPHGDQYNPFTYVDSTPEKVAAGVWKIAEYLVPESKPEGMWSSGARQIIVSCALYLYGLDKVPTLPMIRQMIYTPEGFIPWCREFMSKEENIELHHPETINGFGSVASNPVNTVGGFITTAQQALNPLSSDLAASVLSGNTFDLRELRRRPITIYVVMRPNDREQFAPIARLFFQQLIDVNSKTEFSELPPDSHEVLLGLDEFATLGKLPAISNGINVIRSYGIRMLVIVQSPTQLTSLYGKDDGKTFTDNFGCSVFYTPGARDMDTAEELSKLLGNKTVRGRSESRRKHGVMQPNAQITTSDQRRPLMLPQEVMSMDGDTSIIRISGCKPIRGSKILAATDTTFINRMLEPLIPPKLPVVTTWTRAKPKKEFPNLTGELLAPFPNNSDGAGHRVDHSADKESTVPTEDLPVLKNEGESDINKEINPESPSTMESTSHIPTELDLQNLSSASTEDFDLNFSDVALPSKLGSPEEVNGYVEKILSLTEKH